MEFFYLVMIILAVIAVVIEEKEGSKSENWF